MRRLLVLAVVSAAVVAGCGSSGGGSRPYTAAATAPCLKQKGFTDVSMDPAKVGFIAGVAENGGLYAKSPTGIPMTIAFAADAKDAAATEVSYRQHAPASLRRHIADIMESQSNAVLVWTESPSSDQLSLALGCLRSG
ncbi:MAG TPA: hypothetical protein VFM96_07100 [Gaiellaceae bacterium]|nr:hypothetical protein [Gaiellaceae bacterium]